MGAESSPRAVLWWLATAAVWLGLVVFAIGAVQARSSMGSAAQAPHLEARPALALATAAPQPTLPMFSALPTFTATPEPTATMPPAPEPTATPLPTDTPVPAPTDPPPTAPPAAEMQEPTWTPAPTPTPTSTAPKPTRLVIPAIELDTPVVEVGWHEEWIGGVLAAVWDVAAYAAGWHNTSARPGDPDNMVLAGHHNINGEIFRDLVTLTPGAEVSVWAGDVEHHYIVTEVVILPDRDMPLSVRQENGRWISQTGSEMATLVTCWPYNNNTHRVMVRALPAGQ